jgi:putative nucleotidyltransferase with HDIG domain
VLDKTARKIRRDIILRSFLGRHGILKVTLMATLCAMLSSFLLYWLIGTIVDAFVAVGIVSSILVPALVSPPIVYSLLRLTQKLGLAEKELLNAYNSLELQVRVRTVEFVTANRHLQDEIAKRMRTEQKLQRGLERLNKSLEKSILAIAAVTEIRDPFTAGHQKRVTELACAIAKEMGLAKGRRERLRLAAMVHDVGKVNIPTEILIKPDRLSEPEFNIIEAHPQIGHDILQRIDFSRPIAKIVLQHHELLDGSGYPQKLTGNNILLEARILAVADAVEAMTSQRPYRPAHGLEGALKEVSNKRGILYDPHVVDACLRVFRERAFSFE